MFSGYRTIFWGLFVITFHINFITIPILPAFVGYMIMSSGVRKLQEEFSSANFNKARTTALFLAILGVFGLACDEAAVKELRLEERKGYTRTLLNYAVADKTVFSSAFGSSKVKLRIQKVLTYRQITRFSAFCFGIMVLVIAFLLLTNGVVK